LRSSASSQVLPGIQISNKVIHVVALILSKRRDCFPHSFSFDCAGRFIKDVLATTISARHALLDRAK
jgi:hypothetical protein